MHIQLIRSATIKLNYAGKSILIDPNFAPKHSMPSYQGKTLNPLVELPMQVEEILNDLDVVVISHLHTDHFDRTAKALLPPNLPILCQKEDCEKIQAQGFKNVLPVKDHIHWGGIKITRTTCQHGSGEVLKDMGSASGFLFENVYEPTVYWVGDSIFFKDVEKIITQRKPQIILTHSCGAVWGNNVKIVMDEVQTVTVCKIAPESIVAATHLDAYDHSTVSRTDLRKYADTQGISPNQLLIPSDGETYEFSLNKQ